MSRMSSVTTYRGGCHLTTPHPADRYPGVLVVRPAQWRYWVIVPEDGHPITAHGGERLVAYRLVDGIETDGFVLVPGDRVTRVRADLPRGLAAWRVERGSHDL